MMNKLKKNRKQSKMCEMFEYKQQIFAKPVYGFLPVITTKNLIHLSMKSYVEEKPVFCVLLENFK